MILFLGLLFLYLMLVCLIIAFFIGASETDDQE